MRDRQYLEPVLVRGGKTERLTRIPFAERTYSENDLQGLLFANPSLLPVAEIEPVFEGLRPVARELPVGGLALDLLYMNAQGYLTLVETKLYRNPEARRAVVSQILEYAKEMSSWTFEDLEKAVASCRIRAIGANSVVDVVRDEGEDGFDEAWFIDKVTRNLRLGRFLLLIVGDGIQEGVEELVEFLNQTPQLRFRLALVEMGLYRFGNGRSDEILIQPRLLTRTREVVRAVVEVKTTVEQAQVSVTMPAEERSRRAPIRAPITEEAFLEELRIGAPEAVEFASWVIEEAPKHSLELDWGDAGPLLKYVDKDSGHEFTLGQLNRRGFLTSTQRLSRRLKTVGLPASIYRDYLDRVAALIPGASRKESDEYHAHIATGDNPKRDAPPLVPHLAAKRDEWLRIIDDTVTRIRDEMLARDDKEVGESAS